MKRILLNIAIMVAALAVLSSCDFLRTIAGRPTSVDINAKKNVLAVDETRQAVGNESNEEFVFEKAEVDDDDDDDIFVDEEAAALKRKAEIIALLRHRADSAAAADAGHPLPATKPAPKAESAPATKPAPKAEPAPATKPAAKSRYVSGIRVTPVSAYKVHLKDSLTHKYYLILGAFTNADNAAALAKRVQAAGYKVECINCTYVGVLVGACPSDDSSAFFAEIAKARQEKFCPSDAWVLSNE